VMDRSRRLLGGPEIGSCGLDLGGGGLDRAISGVREPALLMVSFAAGCQLALGFGVGVVDPRAKRRFWD
jgi:hypothetical protein